MSCLATQKKGENEERKKGSQHDTPAEKSSYFHFSCFQLGSYFIHLTDEEMNLRQQVKDLKLEQSSVSMSDEFAKYMKLQRKIDRLVDQVKKMGKHMN